ncbi:MAG: terminase family protein [Bacillota bacterium]
MNDNILTIQLTKKQHQFQRSEAFETLFGGAAGGGKSYAQIVDSLVFAIKYPKSKQILLRRTLVELEKSLLRTAIDVYPKGIYIYRESKHSFEFVNGSIIDFGYIGQESDVWKYQSTEYDIVRFDELTHFSESMYLYMLSRVRGANDFPKGVKSTTNPGGVGHDFVRKRFVDIGEWGKLQKFETGNRIFIPSLVFENKFLMDKDPDYVKRLENLSQKDKQALLYGNWDIFEGRFFPEFSRDTHVCDPFEIPQGSRIFCVFDYGLDMLACYFIAVDSFSNCYVFKEIYKPGLIISECAELIKDTARGQPIEAFIAPPDMWNRNREAGQSVAGIFKKYGITLQKTNARRDVGWFELKELLKVGLDEFGNQNPRLKIFSCCTNLIRCLGSILVDTSKVFDCANHPHELTHSVDAIRYFASFQKKSGKKPIKTPKRNGDVGMKITKI